MPFKRDGFKPTYTKEKVNQICKMIAETDLPITAICKAVKMNPNTFYEWVNDLPEFKIRVNEAKQIRNDIYVSVAREGLLTLLKGKEWQETTDEYVYTKPNKKNGNKQTEILKSRKIVNKFLRPDVTSVIFTLKTLDRKTFEQLNNAMLLNADGTPYEPNTEDNKFTIVHISSPVPLAHSEDEVEMKLLNDKTNTYE